MPMSDVIGCHKSPCPVAPRDECITQLAHHLNSQFHSKKKCRIVFFLVRFSHFFLTFFPGTICLVFATVWNQNLSFCMVFATFWHGHVAFCMVFATFGNVRLPFCMVLPHFGTSTSHLNGICNFLVRQTFMWVAFRVLFRV